MTTAITGDSAVRLRHFCSAWLLFATSVAAVPVCIFFGASRSGKNYFGEGLEGSLYWPVLWTVLALSFVTCVVSPCIYSRWGRRTDMVIAWAALAFLVDLALSVYFVGSMFAD